MSGGRPSRWLPGGPATRIYAIADAEALGGPSFSVPTVVAAVAAIAGAGIRSIQLRAKRLSGADFHRLLDASCRALAGSGADLWVNDRADLAALCPVAGLHLGQTDLPPAAARRVVGDELAIGLSTHDEAQLAAAAADPDVDLVAIGPVFATASKEGTAPVVGLESLRRARARTAKRLVAIGGIDAGNVSAVLAAGADQVAVLGAICRGDVASNCRQLVAAVGCASS
ncbi:MAG TPA: thiamine phosphate synthase [Thermoanaerobaculia bacterium]|nr:thiamine phosphate synthase [Thermoanaerobaculia bacterium]